MPTDATEPITSSGFFASSSQVAIFGGQFVQNDLRKQDDPNKHLALLYREVAPNAILNSGGRVDAVRCYPGTREEVIGRIESWRVSGYLSDRRIFWLSGPAGAGKSAISQTIAEHWIKQNVPVANFFFFRTDPSRNNVRPVIATLLYQILKAYPELKPHINSIIENDPVILRQSIHTQSQRLIHEPVSSIRQESPSHPPIILLIDGLDECDSESTKEGQSSMLHLLNQLVMSHNSPFIALVASRVEPRLMMAFNELGTFHASIFLDKTYRPSEDVRRFIVGELASIKQTHHLGHSLVGEWPSAEMITSIVDKSSGQFVYAATVARFIRNSSASPAVSMQTVLGLRPVKKISPFAELDAIYAHILSQVEDWDAARDILATHEILASLEHVTGSYCHLESALSSLGYLRADIESCFSDLTCIIQLDTNLEYLSLHFHHASLRDFLHSKIRAGKYYVDLNAVACDLVAVYFKETHKLTYGFLSLILGIFTHVSEPSCAVNDALQYAELLPVPTYTRASSFQRALSEISPSFFAKVDELYKQRDPELHRSIATSWSVWFTQRGFKSTNSNVRSSGDSLPLTVRQAPQTILSWLKTNNRVREVYDNDYYSV